MRNKKKMPKSVDTRKNPIPANVAPKSISGYGWEKESGIRKKSKWRKIKHRYPRKKIVFTIKFHNLTQKDNH